MVATELGKDQALKALAERREANKTITRIDNSKLYAGEPMYFYCIGCGAQIMVPEGYITKPDCCPECTAMRKLGWLN